MWPRRRLTAPRRHRAPIARALGSASIGRRVISRSRVPEGGRATTPVGLAVELESLLRELHPGVGRLLELLVPAFGRLELFGVALGLEPEALDHRDEAVALLGRRGADPPAHDVIHLDLARAPLLGDRLALIARRCARELAQP